MNVQKFEQKEFSHLKILGMLCILALITALMLLVVNERSVPGNLNAEHFIAIITFLFNIALSSFALIQDAVKKKYSMIQIYWTFSVIFFGISPLGMFLLGYEPWGYPMNPTGIIQCNILLAFWSLLLFSSSHLFAQNTAKKRNLNYCRSARLLDALCNRRFLFLSLLLAVAASCALVQIVGFDNLFSRSTYSTGEEKSSALIADKVLRGTVVFNTVFQIIAIKNKKGSTLFLLTSLSILLLACFPAGMPRYNMAVIYLGLLITAFSNSFKGGLLSAILIFGLLAIFPAVNVFRVQEFSIDALSASFYATFSSLAKGFLTADYDAYSMFYRAIDYVSETGLIWGQNFLVALFFFVPRAWWTSKPMGSGHIISSSQGQFYTNLSCPLPAEFYISFGIVGVIIGSIVVARICHIVDERVSQSPFYPFLLLLFFFICRGDLLSSFAYLVGYGCVYIAMTKIAIHLNKTSRERSQDGEVHSRKPQEFCQLTGRKRIIYEDSPHRNTWRFYRRNDIPGQFAIRAKHPRWS